MAAELQHMNAPHTISKVNSAAPARFPEVLKHSSFHSANEQQFLNISWYMCGIP